MPSTNQPFGCLPIRHDGGGTVRPVSLRDAINSGYGTAISTGQPVTMTSSGVLNAVTAVATEIYGIFAGTDYVDNNGNPVNQPNWTASTTATDIVAWVWKDPQIVFKIQANGTVASTARGGEVDFANFTSANNGFSQCVASNNASTLGQLRVVDKYNDPGNDWPDPYTILEVTLSQSQIIATKSGV